MLSVCEVHASGTSRPHESHQSSGNPRGFSLLRRKSVASATIDLVIIDVITIPGRECMLVMMVCDWAGDAFRTLDIFGDFSDLDSWRRGSVFPARCFIH